VTLAMLSDTGLVDVATSVAERACRFAHAELSESRGALAPVLTGDEPRPYWGRLSPTDRDLCDWLWDKAGWRPPV